MKQSEHVRALHQQIETLKADNERLRKFEEELCDALSRSREEYALGHQIRATAGRFWSDVLYWKFVVLVLAIEAIRLGLDISRMGR